ncbi:MAG: sensor histidine kinase [Lachnospiraceae bacterium]|nr:sensor histidine kinase [Lachnospiraceae bacterium]
MGVVKMNKMGKMSFQMQLTVSLLGCLFVSVAIILVCLMLNIRETERSNQIYIERQDEQWATDLDFMMAAIDKMRFLHLADDEVERIVTEGKNQRQDFKIADEQYMSRLLNVLCTTNSDVLRITVVTSSGDIYGNYVEDSETSVTLAREHLLYGDENSKSRMFVTDVYEGTINLVPYSLLTFQYPLYEVARGESLGTVYIDMNFGAMRERFDALENQDGWSKYILNGNGVIYASDQEFGAAIGAQEQEKIMEFAKTGGGAGRLKINGETYAVHVKYLEALDWCLIQCVKRSSFISGEMRRINLLAFWVILLLCGQIYVGTLLMKRISAPIKTMSLVMSQAATKERKELNYMECREEYPREVQEIAFGYNAMIKRIHENIIREYENELIQKKTELQMLQYQINPHFLYNTLNIMSSIARLHEIPYISDISESLSRIFFYNVKGGQVVSLQDELDNLQNYIRIQRIRFPEKFEVSYEIEPELEKCRILKFLLQPLVENAIDHGIGEKRRKGRIVIRANRTDEEKAEIVIEDNGVGIAKEKLKMLQNMLNEEMETIQEKDKGGIGIRNVQMRIRNYYGSSYGILLESKEGYGTKIRIILPVLKGEE